jgi:hypothetical protein
MRDITPRYRREEDGEDLGCAYIVDESGSRGNCGAPRQAFSSYCPHHHSLCYIACGSNAEARRLREVEKLASAVGGRRGRQEAGPSRQFLERLEHVVRGFPRPKSSGFVRRWMP